MFSCLLTGGDILTIAAAIVAACLLIAFGVLWYFFLVKFVGKDIKTNPTDNEEKFEIKISRYLIGTMIFFAVLFGAFAALCLILYLAKVPDYLSLQTTVLITCVFGVAALIIAIYCVLFKRWRVIVRGDNITYISLIGKRREFLWGEITKVEKVSNADSLVKVYFNKDKKPAFTLNGVLTGVGLFIKKLQNSGKIFL
ncbi:MAG: hypothetical protein NC033_01700 [Clostridiales bacterium]|nr:hypothetical protein [Clostridiales bacterium]